MTHGICVDMTGLHALWIYDEGYNLQFDGFRENLSNRLEIWREKI
jgi:hypothetical protein